MFVIDEWIDDFPSDADSNNSDIETDMHSLPISDNKAQEEPKPGPSKLSQVLWITYNVIVL